MPAARTVDLQQRRAAYPRLAGGEERRDQGPGIERRQDLRGATLFVRSWPEATLSELDRERWKPCPGGAGREALQSELRASYERAEQKLREIRRQLVPDPVRYSQPQLLDQLKYLYQNLDRADQVPGRDAYERFGKLSTMLRDLIRELERIAGEEPAPDVHVTQD